MTSDDGPPSVKKARAAAANTDNDLHLREGRRSMRFKQGNKVLFEVRTSGTGGIRTAQCARNRRFVI